jgi:glycosidase
MSAGWVEHVQWWHVYPLGFTGAPIRPDDSASPEHPQPDVVHRLPQLEGWLDHIVGLGLNGLALGPVFTSTTHGYDTTDHFSIDPRLGDTADLDHLIEEAKAKGVRVLLDGVFNHVGREHPLFRDVEQRGTESPHAALFRIDWTGWRRGDPVAAEVFEGHSALVALDHGSPEVADLVVEIMNHWLDRGIDGWRLDAAYAVAPAFWAEVLPRVRERHPDVWFSAEVIHGADRRLAQASTIDSFTQYELWQGIWHGIADRNLFELSHAVERHGELLEAYVPSTFIGNHDVTRIASAVGAEFVPHALAALMTVAGTPSIYAGDEYAMTGVKEQRLGGDDAVRPAFADTPPVEATLDPEARELLRVHRELIGLRRRHPWLHTARTDVVHIANETLVLRTATGEGALITALSVAATERRMPAAGATDVLAGPGRLEGAEIVLPAGGWMVARGAIR